MSAKEMFEKLGYEIDNKTIWYPERYKHICYKNDLIIILFVISDDDIHFDKFYQKIGTKQNDCCNYSCSISYKELQAINKQVEELGGNNDSK